MPETGMPRFMLPLVKVNYAMLIIKAIHFSMKDKLEKKKTK